MLHLYHLLFTIYLLWDVGLRVVQGVDSEERIWVNYRTTLDKLLSLYQCQFLQL